MENYRQAKIRPIRSLRDLRLASVQTIIKPWTGRGELLEDVMEADARH